MKSNEKTEKARDASLAETPNKKNSLKEKISGEERLQKLMARAGIASRRAAEKLIADGQVAVNGHVTKELGAKADPLVDKITVSGRPLLISDAAPTVVLLHKPRGFMTTKNDPEGRPIVLDLLPKKLQKLNPVGRLDFDTSGVLLLTDDGDLLHLLTHPSHGVEKVYHARVGGQVKLETVKILEGGVYITEGDENSKAKIKTAPCRVRVRAQTDKNALVEVTLREGRNRQVRKMLETMGHAVSSLRRIKFAGLELEEIPSGGYRLLLPGEIHALRKAATKIIQKKQSRAEVLKEASEAIEARARRMPRPKTPAKFVSRSKKGSDDVEGPRPASISKNTLARPVQPSRSTYGTKNQTDSTGKSRPARVSAYEASGQEKPRPYAPRASANEGTNPRTPGARTTRTSSYKPGGEEKPRAYPSSRASSRDAANPRAAASRPSAAPRASARPVTKGSSSEDKPLTYSTSRSSTSPNARPRNPTKTSESRGAAAPRRSSSTKPEAPLGERIRRQWKDD